MEIKGRFDHFNINVTDLDRSLAFYREALGLHEIKRARRPPTAASCWPIWATTGRDSASN